jgi:hypothetical protein
VFATQKGLQLFEGFEEGDIKVKMHKSSKKRNLMGSWEGPYDFVSYKDGKGCQKQNEGNKTCIIKKLDGNCWERARKDL